ncbi:MAG: hypothetical protein D4S02_11695 [Rhodocyclaceae bacterium]|nr:MAG: hypothetical protein D4S02_11695 [Rhodocyclaceae bacterium]
MLYGVKDAAQHCNRTEPEMPVPRDAYSTATRLYLPEAYCFDEKSLFRDVDAAMNKLQGEMLRMALRHLYIKWGDYSDAGREEFASDLMNLAEARRVPPAVKPARRRFQSPDVASATGMQAELF